MVVSSTILSVLSTIKTIAWVIFGFCLFFYTDRPKPRKVMTIQLISILIVFAYYTFIVISGVYTSGMGKLSVFICGLCAIIEANILRKMPPPDKKE